VSYDKLPSSLWAAVLIALAVGALMVATISFDVRLSTTNRQLIEHNHRMLEKIEGIICGRVSCEEEME
jgi:hypothetical protein